MIKKGRIDDMEVSVLIQAPPIPSDRSNNGPTQHTEAPTAANIAPIPSQLEFVFMGNLI